MKFHSTWLIYNFNENLIHFLTIKFIQDSTSKIEIEKSNEENGKISFFLTLLQVEKRIKVILKLKSSLFIPLRVFQFDDVDVTMMMMMWISWKFTNSRRELFSVIFIVLKLFLFTLKSPNKPQNRNNKNNKKYVGWGFVFSFQRLSRNVVAWWLAIKDWKWFLNDIKKVEKKRNLCQS